MCTIIKLSGASPQHNCVQAITSLRNKCDLTGGTDSELMCFVEVSLLFTTNNTIITISHKSGSGRGYGILIRLLINKNKYETVKLFYSWFY